MDKIQQVTEQQFLTLQCFYNKTFLQKIISLLHWRINIYLWNT